MNCGVLANPWLTPRSTGPADAVFSLRFASVAAARLPRHVGRHDPAGRTIEPFPPGERIVKYDIECEREDDGRWLAEVPQLPGVLAYGATRDEATARVQILALRVLAEKLEHGESGPQSISISVAAA